MFGDYSVLLAAVIMSLAGFTVAAEESLELTERAAVELALSRPAFQEAEQGRLATARSDVTQATLYSNPLLALGRERVGGTESSIQLAQSFDISGKRTLRREAADIRVEAAQRSQQDRRNTGHAHSGVVVPASAVVDDNGQPVVFVQQEGESFERRIVTLGVRDADRVAVRSGVKVGERVVTKGAYQVRLAATAPAAIGHGHAH